MLPVQLSTLLLIYLSYVVFQQGVIGVAIMHVLILDDHFAEIIARQLNIAEKIKSFPASTIKEARNILQTIKVDAAVLDVNLGFGMTGIDFIKEVKEKDKSILTIIITGNVDPTLRNKSIEAGADDFISDSFDYNDMLPLFYDKIINHEITEKKAVERWNKSTS